MVNPIRDFYRQYSEGEGGGTFHKVISLEESSELSWEMIQQLTPKMCRGWYELTHLSPKDRIEFIRDYWLSKLPYHPHILENITQFFDSLEDIQIYIVQRIADGPHESHLVYCLSNDRGFFYGKPGASEKQIAYLQGFFGTIFPQDYLSFMQIHNGFSKSTDTGILALDTIEQGAKKFWEMAEKEIIVSASGRVIDPKTLIPFYESFGMPFFQCFWTEWYPDQEMGNVYFSGVTHAISDVEGETISEESMAFPTFMDWLFFYLEKVE